MWRCGFGERESSAPPSIASGRTSDNGERQPQVTMVDRTIHTASSSFTVRREYLYLRPIDKVDLDDSKKRSKDKRKQPCISQTVTAIPWYHHHLYTPKFKEIEWEYYRPCHSCNFNWLWIIRRFGKVLITTIAKYWMENYLFFISSVNE